MNPSFIPGRELCERFYREAVRPILRASFPRLKHSAALIGPGSEVLGFDDELSTDHHWEPLASGPVNHRVTVQTIRGFFMEYLSFDIDQPPEPADWLSFSEQALRSI